MVPKVMIKKIKFCLWISGLGLAVVLSGALVARASRYTQDDRVQRLIRSFEALQVFSRKSLQNSYEYVSAVDRNQCDSDVHQVRVKCLMNFAPKVCKSVKRKRRKDCHIVVDTLISLRLGERRFLSKRDKFRILRNSQQNKSRLDLELKMKWANLSFGFCSHRGRACADTNPVDLAQELDTYCLNRSGQLGLSWQECVSAILLSHANGF